MNIRTDIKEGQSTMSLRFASLAAAAALAAASMSFPQTGAAQSKRVFIAIGTGGPTGVYFVTGNAICRMLHKEAAEGRKKGRKHGIRCSAPSTNGSTYNIAQIKAGELDFGVAQSDWQYHAYHGSSDRVTKFPKLRSVFSVHPEAYQLVVRKGSGIESWKDLKGKRLNIGNPGSGQRQTTELLMEKYGTARDYFSLTTELTSTEHSTALCDGKIDAFGYVVGIPNSGVAVATDGCLARIVSLNTDVEKKLIADRPYYARAVVPKGTYKSTTEDVETFGVMATVVTSADVADSTVYELTRAVMENMNDFRRLHPAYAKLQPAGMIKDGLSAPHHPGAAKYYREKGWIQ